MMRALPLKNFVACVAVLLSLLVATSSFADDKSVKLQVAEVATSFIEPLPMDKKYVIKSLSPDATGIPEDFLRKLTSDVEAGLLFASDNEMNLINRDATEEIWQEATEFNNAQFQELYTKSSADVMIMISPRLTADGVEISLTAYELSGDYVGKVLASSGTSVLEMDVKATLGVDVNDLNTKMDTVLNEIKKDKVKQRNSAEAWGIGFGMGYEEHTVSHGDGNSINISCNINADVGPTGILTEISGKSPPANSNVMFIIDGETIQLYTDTSGNIPTDCHVCASNFDYLIEKLSATTDESSLSLIFSDGRSQSFSTIRAADSFSEENSSKCIADFFKN